MDDGITGLAGVIVWTTADRFPRLRDFYVTVLGLTPRSERPGFVNFAWGLTRMTISVHDRLVGLATDPLRIMVNLAVDDMDAVHARLTAAGVTFNRPPEREEWGGRIATFTDPDGNVLQLLEIGP